MTIREKEISGGGVCIEQAEEILLRRSSGKVLVPSGQEKRSTGPE